MKLNNLEMAVALGDLALGYGVGSPRCTELMQLADYLATHPTSGMFYERAVQALGVDPDMIPTELWGTATPGEAEGAQRMKDAITYLNTQWHGGKLQRRIAVRNLAWAATLLARRLDADCEQDCKDIVARGGGTTAGLFRPFIPQAATRAELAAAAATAAQVAAEADAEAQSQPQPENQA